VFSEGSFIAHAVKKMEFRDSLNAVWGDIVQWQQ